jgi:hypothetical protein
MAKTGGSDCETLRADTGLGSGGNKTCKGPRVPETKTTQFTDRSIEIIKKRVYIMTVSLQETGFITIYVSLGWGD